MCTRAHQSQQRHRFTTPSPGQPNKIAEDATAAAMTSGNRILIYAAKVPPEKTNNNWHKAPRVCIQRHTILHANATIFSDVW